MSRTLWYADGLRWIGTIFNDAAEHLEREAAEASPPDPQAIREIDRYMNEMRTRVHAHPRSSNPAARSRTQCPLWRPWS